MKKIFLFLTLFIHFCLPSFSQYFFVLPLPYPIDYLEQVPEAEEVAIEEEETIEEAPATEFSPLSPPDFQNQKALGYEFGVTFKVPEGLRHQVNFWKKIYQEYSIDEYVLHDSLYHLMIYRTVNIRDINQKKISYRQQRRLITNRLSAYKKEIRDILYSIHRKKNDSKSLSSAERRIYEEFSQIPDPNKFLKAAREIRAQLGQKERFEQGIIWAGRYLGFMEKIFQEEQVPIELTRLPFVESSFNIKARSKVGASGVWQFMRSTGSRYMSINSALDERNDPIEATRAAAKLLKHNYLKLKNWPLAITAYNHGASGMGRAVRQVDSEDLIEIIQKYRSRTFGFASKNFYAEFLAALETELDYPKYFGSLRVEAPLTFDEVEIKNYIHISKLIEHTSFSKELLKRYNPALTNYVFSGKKLIPSGYLLKLPPNSKEAFLEAYVKIPKQQKQSKVTYHRVRRGDTLIYLARLYDTTVSEIRDANRIRKHIFTGQLLVIPK